MKKLLLLLTVFVTLISLASCAKFENRVEANGGILGSYQGDWIIVARSGGVVTDIYKLEKAMVQSEQTSDGWLFVKDGSAVHVSGDVKAIRVNDNKVLWDSYKEYHQELDDPNILLKDTLKNKVAEIVVEKPDKFRLIK